MIYLFIYLLGKASVVEKYMQSICSSVFCQLVVSHSFFVLISAILKTPFIFGYNKMFQVIVYSLISTSLLKFIIL